MSISMTPPAQGRGREIAEAIDRQYSFMASAFPRFVFGPKVLSGRQSMNVSGRDYEYTS